MLSQQYCLRWKHHHSNVQNMFAQLLEKERFCDVTLYCSPNFATQVPQNDTVAAQNGVSLRAHRVVLAACSELLGTLLGAHEAQGEPVLVIDGAEPDHLKALLDYMYTGEMNVHHSQLASLLKTAEELRIKGLTDIRWNNKDEPPDCSTGAVATTRVPKPADPIKTEAIQDKPAHYGQLSPTAKQSPPPHSLPARHSPPSKHPQESANDLMITETRTLKKEPEDEEGGTRLNVNGGPPPLIKLPIKEKHRLTPKRENSDSEHSPSPKRQRLTSGTENTDEDSIGAPKLEREDWRHGNLDISAERVVGWGEGTESSREISDDEWADAPADIGSFLHTRLQVDGDMTGDDESNDSGGRHPPTASSTPALSTTTVSIPIAPAETLLKHDHQSQMSTKPTIGPKSGPSDPRFTDVVKLSDYLQHGRRPQFWEQNYVKRVMEAVRLKELEMKQAAEILGVSYGTLYGRYRDVYGCINRPYRAVRDFWQVKGPSEVLERLQRGEISLDAAASALGVSVANLAAHVADFGPGTEFDPIPIEVDPSLCIRTYNTGSSGKAAPVPQYRKIAPASLDAKGDERSAMARRLMQCTETDFDPIPIEGFPSLRNRSDSTGSSGKAAPVPQYRKTAPASLDAKTSKKVVVGSTNDEESIPVSIISTHDAKTPPTTPTGGPATRSSGKWPTIRVANIESLRSDAPAASPSQLMRTRPDLTIVAAKKQDIDLEEDT